MRTESLGGLTVRIAGGEDREGGGDGPIVVLLHGFGAPGTDLVGLWRELEVPRAVRFAFPEGPIDLGPMAFGGRAWWPIDMAELDRRMRTGTAARLADEEPPGLDAARDGLLSMLTALRASLGAKSPLFLGGFSQGAMLSCDAALRSDVPLAGLALLSGTLLARARWLAGAPSRKGLRVVQSHGTHDPILPFMQAEALRDLLVNAGLEVQWLPFRGQHEIPRAAVDALAALVR